METGTALNLISRERLASIIQSPVVDTKSVAIIDVRDADHVGGQISQSTWVPSGTLDHKLPELVRNLQGKQTVVFHCALSQQRGPGAALRYLKERDRLLGLDPKKPVNGSKTDAETEDQEGEGDGKVSKEEMGQQVFVLDGGFVKWQEKYGSDETLTTGWVKDIWEDQ
ncbi:MAG: hypothetical protein M1814_000377 [Vezdaea aestivalis]|nr:MAG: hypothetical protein M1814_000377 [Vezdaea aestivalis]